MTGLKSLGWTIHDHLKSARPKMFKQLKDEGKLNQYVLDRQRDLRDRLSTLEDQGLYPHEARELLRDEIYLPTEGDLPNLGEQIQPYTD